MQTRFAHITDVHLGYQQYGLTERYNDFGRSWLDAVERIMEANPEFVVLSGDLFHKRNPEPLTLIQAEAGLQILRDRSIPIVGVSGNHDRTLDREAFSWMEYLAHKQLLILLNPIDPASGEICYAPCDAQGIGGSYVDIGRVRVIGQPYLGAQAADVIRRMADQIAEVGVGEAEYVVYVCHAGVEGMSPEQSGGLSNTQINPLRPFVDYAALGHIHIAFQKDGWLYNPGSLENCSFDEAEHDHGFYVIDVNTALDTKHVVTAHSSLRRSTRRYRIQVDEYDSPEALLAGVSQALLCPVDNTPHEKSQNDEAAPLIEVVLLGTLRFEPGLLALSEVETRARMVSGALYVTVRNLAVSQGEAPILEERTRPELERNAFVGLFTQHDPYSEQPKKWAEIATDAKNLAIDGADGVTLANFLENKMIALGVLEPARVDEESVHANS